jgi:hypothetical protein
MTTRRTLRRLADTGSCPPVNCPVKDRLHHSWIATGLGLAQGDHGGRLCRDADRGVQLPPPVRRSAGVPQNFLHTAVANRSVIRVAADAWGWGTPKATTPATMTQREPF